MIFNFHICAIATHCAVATIFAITTQWICCAYTAIQVGKKTDSRAIYVKYIDISNLLSSRRIIPRFGWIYKDGASCCVAIAINSGFGWIHEDDASCIVAVSVVCLVAECSSKISFMKTLEITNLVACIISFCILLTGTFNFEACLYWFRLKNSDKIAFSRPAVMSLVEMLSIPGTELWRSTSRQHSTLSYCK